ncbi:hypothetical protein ABK040_001644 [Willaertia magna]
MISNFHYKNFTKNCLILLLRAFFNGLQWVGWSWAVLISQQIIVSLLGWNYLRDIIVSFSIATNETIWSQVFGRITLKVDKLIFNKNLLIDKSEMNSIHKNMIACIVSGIVFDFIDRAIESIYSNSAYYNITLLMRCICVFVADRIVFHITIEILDRIECGSWTFSNEISNIESASSAGMSAIAYNLSTELGIYICKHRLLTDNKWIIGLVCSPLIVVATGFGFIVAVIESKLWNLLDNSRIYFKLKRNTQ